MNTSKNQDINMTNSNEVLIVGAGPGAEDLITVRGANALEKADIVVYAGSLVSTVHLKRCQNTCKTHDSANLSLEEQVAIMAQGIKEGKNVVRLHTGDPSMYGAINEQIRALHNEGITTRIIPGVSSVFAAAAALGCELTSPDISQSVVLTRTPGRTPMPPKEKASSFAKTGATLVFFLSTANIETLMKSLLQEGEVHGDTPTAVVYRASWPDERILRGTVSTITKIVQDAGLGRQALIFVGKALGVNLTESKLYDAKFSHGYRNTLEKEYFYGKCALYAFTDKALIRAQEIATGLALPSSIYTTRKTEDEKIISLSKEAFKENFIKNWHAYDAHIFVSATGIAVRHIAPHLHCKSSDPATIVCSENGSHVISLLSGHLGGANRLARRIARITQGQAIISTATDINGLTAFDDVVEQEHAKIDNINTLQYLNAALLHQEKIAFCGTEEIYYKYFANIATIQYVKNPHDIQTKYVVMWDDSACTDSHEPLPPSVEHVLKISSKNLILGIGCKRDTPIQELQEKFKQFLAENNIRQEQIVRMASCDLKKDEPAILELAKNISISIDFYSAQELDAIEVPNPSDRVFGHTKTHSVSEAASLLSAGFSKDKESNPKICIPKTTYGTCTFCISTLPHTRICLPSSCEVAGQENIRGSVTVVGVGSGSAKHITPEVSNAILTCDTIAGYSNYIDLVKDRIAGKTIIKNGMMGEVQRCQDTLDAALNGKNVCMICSGDPGILAMAGLLFELRERENKFKNVPISVLPGITSANIAAASLGAPLQNGFSLVSLSDLLVPSEEVRQNLNAVAQSALPVALYNPAGKKRRELLAEALEIFKAQRGKDIWCATVRHAGREEESTWVGQLKDFPLDSVDMSTLVIIGGHRTKYSSGVLYESRGYVDKYLKN